MLKVCEVIRNLYNQSIMELIDVMRDTIEEATEILKEGFSAPLEIRLKEGSQNLVTQYDTASQNAIISRLKKIFPTHHFLAEEDDVRAPPSDEILWIIDPLDGTVNFAHRIPNFAISIAAARRKEIIAGVVYQPLLNEWFIAEKGAGAQLNGVSLSVSQQDTLDSAYLATGFPYNVSENPLGCIERFSFFAKRGIPLRRMGVASLDLAYVAAGRFDAFWEVGLNPWDMAAGALLVEEAGGCVTDYSGAEHPIYAYHPILASNRYLHPQLVEIFKEDLK